MLRKLSPPFLSSEVVSEDTKVLSFGPIFSPMACKKSTSIQIGLAIKCKWSMDNYCFIIEEIQSGGCSQEASHVCRQKDESSAHSVLKSPKRRIYPIFNIGSEASLKTSIIQKYWGKNETICLIFKYYAGGAPRKFINT